MKEPLVTDIPGTDIDVDVETDRFEKWYCWSRCIDLDEFRSEQARLKARGRGNNQVHHLLCMWLNSKRDAANQRATEN